MNLDQAARDETIRYHEDFYATHKLFEDGWLQEPDEELPGIISLLASVKEPRVLDLGCGVGRNAIAIAQALKSNRVRIDCFDMLDSAIERLSAYASQFKVKEEICATCVDMDSLTIEPNSYDAVLAISILEHGKSIQSIKRILGEIVDGTKSGGINRILISADRKATARDTGKPVDTKVETPMTHQEARELLEQTYSAWSIDKLELAPYREELDLAGQRVIWTCTSVSFLARKS
jgi:SAM-dependent methyltransferase